MAAEDVEIRTELALVGIEEIKLQLRDVRARFNEVDKGRDEAQKGFGDWIGTAHQLAGVLGTNLSSIVERVRGMGAEFLHAGSAAETGDAQVAALIATAQGKKAGDAIETAKMLGDALDDVAIKAGVSGDALGNAYQIVLERTGATENGVVRATEQIDRMATIAGKLGKDVGAIATEFAAMEEGQVRVKGQLFQLLQSTGIFGEKTKDAAKTWAALTDEKRAELLAYGLDQLSSKMAKMPPTFAQSQAAFENMIRISKEKIGEPIIRELTPALREVADEVMKLGPDLEELGSALAKEVGQGVREGGRLFRDALGWLRDHKSEIAEDLRAAAKHVKDAFEFVLAHKEEIALAFGAKAAMPLLKPAAGVVADVARSGYGGAGGGVLGVGAGGIGGAATSLGAFTAAIVGVGLAADQAARLVSEMADAEDTRLGGLRRLTEMAETGDVDRTRRTVETMMQLDEAAGRMNPKLKEFYESTIRSAERFKGFKEDDSDRLRKQIAMGQRGTSDLDAMGGAKLGADTQKQMDQFASNQVAILVNAYNQAVSMGDRNMQLLAAQAIAGGQVVGKAFLMANTEVAGGLEAMAELLMNAGPQFAGFAQQLKGKMAAPPAPKISMPGAKITVNQNFRKSDPDNVAIVMKRDLARQVERRTSARYSGIFGN